MVVAAVSRLNERFRERREFAKDFNRKKFTELLNAFRHLIDLFFTNEK